MLESGIGPHLPDRPARARKIEQPVSGVPVLEDYRDSMSLGDHRSAYGRLTMARFGKACVRNYRYAEVLFGTTEQPILCTINATVVFHVSAVLVINNFPVVTDPQIF